MTGRQPRAPACNRQQREVQVVSNRAHAGEEIGVAGEVRGRGAGDEITERRGFGAKRPTPAVVLGVRCTNRDAAYLLFVTGLDLDDVLEAAPAQQGAGAARHDEEWGTSEQPERREVEVVVVDMRDEHHIGPMLVEPESGADASQVEHPRAYHRIGQQAYSVDFEENGAVAEPREALPRAARRAGHVFFGSEGHDPVA